MNVCLTSLRTALAQRALLTTLLAALLTASLAGCGSAPRTGEAGLAGLPTPSEESEARGRARTRLALATGYLENGQAEVALDEFRKALQIDPNLGDVHNVGGLIYLALNEFQLAESHLVRAVALNPRDANAMHNLGWLQCQQGRYAEAAQSFQRALAVPSYIDSARTLMAQGVCEARSGDTAAGEATLKRSYEADPSNPVTGFNLAQLLYQRGDYSRAQFYIRRLNNSELANAESLWLGIKVERKMGNRVAMDQLGSQLRRRFPQSPELLAYERGAFDD